MALDNINLDTTPQQDDTIDLATSWATSVSPEVAQLRASKAAYGGAGRVSDLQKGISEGKEQDMREAFANKIDLAKVNNLSNLINNDLFSPSIFKPTDPKSVFEEKYAEKVMSGFRTDVPAGGTYDNLTKMDPEGEAKVSVAGKLTLAWDEYLKHLLEDKKQEAKDQGWFSWGLDTSKDFIPGFRSVRLSTVPGGTFVESPLPGDKLENLHQKVVSELDFDKRKYMTEDIVKSLNPAMAVEFLNYLDHPTSKQQVLDNTFGALDLFNVGQVGKLGIDAARLLKGRLEKARMYSEALQTISKEADTAPIPAAAMDAVGKPEEAAKVRMDAHIVQQIEQKLEDTAKTATDGMHNVLDTDVATIMKGGTAGNMGAESLNRMKKAWDEGTSAFVRVLKRSAKSIRIGDILEDPETRQALYSELKGKYPGLSGRVLNIMSVRWDNLVNRHVVDNILGDVDGKFLGSAAEALRVADEAGIVVNNMHGVPYSKPLEGRRRTMADVMAQAAQEGASAKTLRDTARLGVAADTEVETKKVGGFTTIAPKKRILNVPEVPKTGAQIHFVEGLDKGIYSQGRGYYIAISRPLDETSSTVQQAVIKTEKYLNKNTGWLNNMGLGWIRTPNDVLSEKDRIDRIVSMFAPGLVKQVVDRAVGKTVRAGVKASPKVGGTLKERWDNFGKNTRFERMLKYGQDNQTEFKDIPTLQDWYMRTFGASANEQEVAGYFAYRQGLAMDYIHRNTQLVKHMSRNGAEQHTVIRKAADGTVDRSPEFVGIAQKEVPDTTYRVLIQNGENFKTMRLSNLSKEERAAVANGSRQLHRIYNEASWDKLKDWVKIDELFTYVLSDKVSTRPLDFIQIPRKAGGHLEITHNWYLRQPKVRVDAEEGKPTYYTYMGDKTAAPVESMALGKDVADSLNKVRLAYKAKDIEAAEIAARGAKGISWAEIKEKFDQRHWDLEQPFYVVPKGKTVYDVPNHFREKYGDQFRDTSKSGGFLDKQFAVEFTGERDAYDTFAFHQDGTIWNPVFNYRPAEYIDPIASLNRAITRIIDSAHMDDVKISSISSWLTRWKGQLDEKWVDEIQNNPWRAFVNAPLKGGLPSNLRGQIESERIQIKLFARIPTKIDTTMAGIQQSLEDLVYGSKSLASKIPLVATKWGFDTAMSAPSFLRKVTYRADIGLFSIPQWLVQQNVYVTILGIAGAKKAGQGTIGAMLHQYSRLPHVTEDILKVLDEKAQYFGYRPGEWLEAKKAFEDTGLGLVSRETNETMPDVHGYRVIKSSLGRFLDASEFFFREGDRSGRYGAWYTAWKEWRDAHPTGRATQSDINGILNRADDFTSNMTTASKSALQMGPLSFPSQFLGYSLRTMELFTGKRLTAAEKMHLLGIYGLVYGVPFTTGLFSVLPFTNQMRQYAMEHGYIEGENGVVDTAFNGLPAYLMSLITGTMYNVGDRYGNLDLANNLLNPSKTWWEALGGASVNMAESIWQSSVPFYKVGAGFVRGDAQLINPTMEDFAQPIKTFAAGNSALRFLMAVNTGDWLSKNESLLARDVPFSQAAFMTVTGLSPIEIDKIQLRQGQKQDWESYWKKAETYFIRDYRRFLRDMYNKDFNNAKTHWNNANVYLVSTNYPIERRANLFAEANQNQTIPEQELWAATFGKNVPADYETYRQQLFSREQQLKAK